MASTNYKLVSVCEEMNPRRRNTMEDVHRVVPVLGGREDLSYLAVYDGHGGRHIVDFLENSLENNIVVELNYDDDASIGERLTRAYLVTDAMSKSLNLTTGGATAVSVLLKNDPLSGRTVHVANVGDSRAVICCQIDPNNVPASAACGYVGHRLTVDHRPDNEGEQARIDEAGGFVARGRVLGILAVTRSFGDHGMKDFVIAEPHLAEASLSALGDCPFLILACDGVWDVLTDQEAVEMVLARYQQEGPFEDAAKLIVHTAMEKGSADNITALVVFL